MQKGFLLFLLVLTAAVEPEGGRLPPPRPYTILKAALSLHFLPAARGMVEW